MDGWMDGRHSDTLSAMTSNAHFMKTGASFKICDVFSTDF